MSRSVIGVLSGILAAVCYGTNPLGALNLYNDGMNTGSVLFCRFGLALIILTIVMLCRGESFRVSRREFMILSVMGVLFSLSSLSLYVSFHYMAAGIASTLLFLYPIMTAVLMYVVFRERFSWTTAVSIVLSMVGVLLLYRGDMGTHLSTTGVILVLISSFTYALYIIFADKSGLRMSVFKVNFYVLIYCTLGALIYACFVSGDLSLPHSAKAWFYACWLAVVPAIMALVLMYYAAQIVGSTATAITGAFEPLTAMLIGVLVFDEPFGCKVALGMALILASVVLIALSKRVKGVSS
ncbi:MAG: DMT family transporter [Bacteroidales bacterium]|nr:DMT family transporter [Bacteroidales bacterium]